MENKQHSSDLKWGVIILAAGYGTRLAKDIVADGSESLQSLLSLPKALLPIMGVPLLDYWYHDIHQCPLIDASNFYIITNSHFYQQFSSWAMLHDISTSNVINDGSISNETRLGAVGDIALCLQEKLPSIQALHGMLIIAGDTLFYEDFKLNDFLDRLTEGHSNDSGVLYYDIKDGNETLKRGIIEVDHDHNATKLLEKPHPSSTPSRKACPAFYAYQRVLFDEIIRFYQSSLSLPLEERDAPGKLLSWFLEQKTAYSNQFNVKAFEISGRFDIGNLAEYRQTLDYFADKFEMTKTKSLTKWTSDKCYARIGLMGNPSDGFKGKTLSFLINNFYAEVFIEEDESHQANESSTARKYIGIDYHASITCIPHPVLDPFTFSSFAGLQSHMTVKGYNGGLRLVQATCKVFSSLCFKSGLYDHLQRGCRIRYETSIPRMVGLSGSSAIVVATFRSLLKFYGLTIANLNISMEDFPQVILDIEAVELGISAGLQDRVIQTYEGLVFMDFTGQKGIYERIDPNLLPPMYLAYNVNAGGESGKVHSTIRERWRAQDPELVKGMQTLGEYASSAKSCIESGDVAQLSRLMHQNFALRRQLYGDNVVGRKNIEVAAVGSQYGLSCKFTGSGGAFVCLRSDGIRGWLSDNDETAAVDAFKKQGFDLVRIEIP